jgi:methylthioribose-1-phosphate isomerase
MEPLVWLGDGIEILDQTRLPWEEVRLRLSTYQEVAAAIKEMRIRGAPLIGIAAAYGMALGAQSVESQNKEQFFLDLNRIAETLASTRPTAVNLFKAIDRMLFAADSSGDVAAVTASLVAEAEAIHAEERAATRGISRLGAGLIRDGSTIVTHCNAGPLATGGYGTALGVIIEARRQGKGVTVLATETRPLLQGARLTVWELMREGVPVTLITDSMAGHFMTRGDVDCAIVGADRIAANGDVANKIGTYALAVLARENAVPFYVAAPASTIDLSLASGDGIVIEQRRPDEVTLIQGMSIAPHGVRAANPAFDVTPHRHVSAIVTDKGILREPYVSSISGVFSSQSSTHG